MERIDTRLRGAISRLLVAETQAEQEEVLQQYPELISPKALEIIDAVIGDFDLMIEDFAEIDKDNFPAMLKKGREFLASKSKS